MKEINLNEKLLKRHLKNKRKITLSMIVAFLIAGGIGFEETEARDLRARKKENNNVVPDYGGPGMNKSSNGTDVVDIVNPNGNGISHNKFVDLNVGNGNGLIFNNSTVNGTSQIGGQTVKNSNLTKSATVILNEVTGNSASNINGDIEVFGGKADFILANENGINLNGATFINTSGVTLTTGKPTVSGNDIQVNVQKGNINLNGVGTSGDYFNVIARTIELHNQIAPISGQSNPDISLIAGENLVKINSGNANILSSTNATSSKYGIYASGLGTMYGKNIRLISTDKGLGVKHEGVILSDKDISIDANGNISLASVNAQGNLDIKGNGLKANSGKVTVGGETFNNAISANGNVNVNISGDVNVDSAIQSVGGNVNITAGKVVNKGLISANKNLKVSADKIDNESGAILKGATLDLVATSSFLNKGEIRENSESNSFVDPNGNIKIEVTLGSFQNYGNITAKKITILAQNLINSLNGKIITTNGDLVLTTTLGELVNNGELLADKNISIISSGDIKNTGKIGGNDILIQGLKGEFLNAGYITAVRKLEIIVQGLVNAGSSSEIEKYLKIFQEYSNEYLAKVEDIIKSLESKIKTETNQEKLKGLKEALGHFNILKTKLQNLKTELGKTGNLGVLSGSDIVVKTTKETINKGIITSDNNLNIDADTIENHGVLQSGKDIILKAVGNILNSQRITAKNNISITGKSFVSLGDDKKIEEYLNLLSKFDSKRLEDVIKQISSLETKLANETNPSVVAELKDQLNTLYKEKQNLDALKAKISAYENLGVIEGNNISITTTEFLQNNGILLSEGDVNLSSSGDITNNGVANVGKSLTVTAKNFTSKNLTVGGSLEALLEEIFSSKDLTVGGDITVNADKFESSGDLSTNSNLTVNADFETSKDANTQVKNNANLNGGVNNAGDLVIGGNLNVDTNGKDFVSDGDLDIGGKANVTTNKFITNGDTTIEGSFDLQAKDRFENSGNFQSKGDMTVTSKGFDNKNSITTEGNLITNSNEGDFTSKDLSVGSNLILNTNSIKLTGKTTVGWEAALNASNGDFLNEGEFHVHKKLSIDANSVGNSGEIISSGLDINMNGDLTNDGSIQSKGDATIKNSSTNANIDSKGDITVDGNLVIDAAGSDLTNDGEIVASGTLTANTKSISSEKDSQIGGNKGLNIKTGNINNHDSSKMTGSTIDIDITGNAESNLGQVLGGKEINIDANGDITVTKLQTPEDINVATTGTFTNKGMIVSNQNINIDGDSIVNEAATTIWAGQNIVLNAIREIYNSLLAVIEAKGNMSLTAKVITNDAGRIKSGKDMTIKTDSLVNKSTVTGDIIDGTIYLEEVQRWNDIFNYHLDFTKITIPNTTNNFIIKDKAEISAGGSLSIEGLTNDKSSVLNESGTISATKDIKITGDLVNKTIKEEITVEWLLDNIQIELYWETRLYGTDALGNKNTTFKGSLKDALYSGLFSGKNNQYYKSLAKHDDPLLNELLSKVLGPDWKSHSKPVSQDTWDTTGALSFYATNGSAQILAGGNFEHSGGKFDNDGGEAGGNKDVTIKIGDNTVDGNDSNLKVDINDINSVKEVDGVKQVHDVDIITGQVTINGVTINAQIGNTAGSIAVAGTISPIIFIDIPNGENGIFRPAKPKPGNLQPLFETNIEFIDPDNFYGTEYFFNQIGYDSDKTTTVVGDAYYEYLLIQKMIKEGVGYAGEIGTDKIKLMLDNAILVRDELGLEIGKPLNPDQINNLEKDIIWYVEVEVNGVIALTPQVYLSKESRIKLANSQGSGGSSTVKAGGDITVDAESFENSNGNIVGGGDIIVKSENNITNNSSGGFSGGITSNKGNVALDAGGDVDIIGGHVTGDNVIIAGKSVNIESTLTIDLNGNQIIGDQAGISANNGILIDAENDVNIKGGSLTASGVEIDLPEKNSEDEKESEKENQNGKEESEEELEEDDEETATEVVKDVDYYKELFKKDSKDIIEGDAGSININAGGSVNIEDVYTVSSGFESDFKDEWNYKEETWAKAESNGSEIKGSNININAAEDINIKGSNLSTNDMNKVSLIEEELEEEKLLAGSINLKAGNNVKIEDSQDVSYSKSTSKKTSDRIEGIDLEGNTYDAGGQLLTSTTTTKETNASVSAGSSLSTGGDLNISAGNDVTLQGSTTVALGNTNISAENDVNILDGRTTVTEKSNTSIYQVLGGSYEKSEKKSSSSVGSNITGLGDINISAGNDMKIVGGNLSSSDGDLNLSAKNNISIEAGKNEYSEKTSAFGMGVFVGGSAKLGPLAVADTLSSYSIDKSKIEIDGSPLGYYPSGGGAPMPATLAHAEVGVKIEYVESQTDSLEWTNSELKGNNINIKAGETVDIGGGNYSATENIDIYAKNVESTKYENKKTEKSQGGGIYIKEALKVEGSLFEAINNFAGILSNGENIDSGVIGGQVVGSLSHLLMSDLVAVGLNQIVGGEYTKSSKEWTSENSTDITAKNITITATEKDINLNGVNLEAENDIKLSAKNNVNITALKATSKEDSLGISTESRLSHGASANAIFGAGAGTGMGTASKLDIIKSEGVFYENSQIKSGGTIDISSGGNLNIAGGNVESKGDTNLDVGGDVNIETKVSTYVENKSFSSIGTRVGVGLATNTVIAGSVSGNIGMGNIFQTLEEATTSGIKAGGSLNADIKGDINMKGGILGSDIGEGTLNVAGDINLETIELDSKSGGAHFIASMGESKNAGLAINVGDKLDRVEKVTSAINVGNINTNGSIFENGIAIDKTDINVDINNNHIIEKDYYKEGGVVSLNLGFKKVKNIMKKAQTGSYDID